MFTDGGQIDIVTETTNVSDTIDSGDKALIDDAAAAAGRTVGYYIDITLNCFVYNAGGMLTEETAIAEPGSSLTFTVDIPEELVNTDPTVNRVFSVIRLHDGVVETLPTTTNNTNGTITFSSDKFSVYAIAYVDTTIPADTDTDVVDNGIAEPVAAPQTGDDSNAGGMMMVMIVAMIGVTGIAYYNRKRNE